MYKQLSLVSHLKFKLNVCHQQQFKIPPMMLSYLLFCKGFMSMSITFQIQYQLYTTKKKKRWDKDAQSRKRKSGARQKSHSQPWALSAQIMMGWGSVPPGGGGGSGPSWLSWTSWTVKRTNRRPLHPVLLIMNVFSHPILSIFALELTGRNTEQELSLVRVE